MNKTKKNKTKKNKTKKLYTYNLSKQIDAGYLQVSNLHSIYYSCYGNKNGIPLLVIHGGPGGSSLSKKTSIYNPRKYFIVLVDQRGCGKSKPFGELRENNTDELIKDFEKLRKHLHIKKWILCGGSWGSTLALVYAIRHPSVVRKMFISGIGLGIVKKDNSKAGKEFFPDEYDKFQSFIPKKERNNLIKAYGKRFFGNYSKKIKDKAHLRWSMWEQKINSVKTKKESDIRKKIKDELYNGSKIQMHYYLHNQYLPKNYILNNIKKIKSIPTYIIQGRFDCQTKAENAYNLHKALPKSKLFFTNGGHSDLINKAMTYKILKKYG